MMNQPVEPTLPLAVTLEAQQWNQIMVVLLDTPNLPLPHRAIASLVQSLNEQLQASAMKAGNGLDHDPLPVMTAAQPAP